MIVLLKKKACVAIPPVAVADQGPRGSCYAYYRYRRLQNVCDSKRYSFAQLFLLPLQWRYGCYIRGHQNNFTLNIMCIILLQFHNLHSTLEITHLISTWFCQSVDNRQVGFSSWPVFKNCVDQRVSYQKRAADHARTRVTENWTLTKFGGPIAVNKYTLLKVVDTVTFSL